MSQRHSKESQDTAPVKGRKRRSAADFAVPLEFERLLEEAATEAAGKPLSRAAFAPGSPLGRLIGQVVERALDEEMRQHLGYDRHQRLADDAPDQIAESRITEGNGSAEGRSPGRRRNTRNGYSSKSLKTSLGTTEIQVPRDRLGEFEPRILPKHRTISQELDECVISMYASGMSTRDIADYIRQLYHCDVSEMFVSRLVERLDPELTAWRNRPLEPIYAVLYFDALYVKVRHTSGVAPTPVYVAIGYGEDGTIDVLGLWMAPTDQANGQTPGGVDGVRAESSTFWHTIFLELQRRGVERVLIACSDNLTGIQDALLLAFPQARWQPCVVHLVRASLRRVSWTDRKDVARQLRTIYTAPSYEAAEQALEACAVNFGNRFPAVIRAWRGYLLLLSGLWVYSPALRKIIYTNNPIENTNRQLRKVIKTRGAFPNAESAKRLLSLVIMRIRHRYSQRSSRSDWSRILDELHLHFADQLPEDWGRRVYYPRY